MQRTVGTLLVWKVDQHHWMHASRNFCNVETEGSGIMTCSKVQNQLYGLRAQEKDMHMNVQLIIEVTCCYGRMARMQKLKNVRIMQRCLLLGSHFGEADVQQHVCVQQLANCLR
jgi:hypothetical protein